MTNEAAPAQLLQQSARAGVHRLPPAAAPEIEAVAGRLGFAVFHVDLEGCTDKAALLTRIAAVLQFPDWFGHNWDALGDCLADMGWHPAPGYVVFLNRTERLPDALAEDFAIALDIFADAARELARAARPMWIFVEAGMGDPRHAFAP